MIARFIYIGTSAFVFIVGAKFLFAYLKGKKIPAISSAAAAGSTLIGEV